MNSRRVVIVGGGAAGFFAAIACAEAAPQTEVIVLERGPEFLTKVRISGGGRCNVTHACFDVRELTGRYPRGEKALIAPYERFQASDTVQWFESRGVKLKTEADGRMFPVTNDSQTIIDCLTREARAAGVNLRVNCGVEKIIRSPGGGFGVTVAEGGARHSETVSKPIIPSSPREERAGRGLRRGEFPIKRASSPRPSPPSDGREGEYSASAQDLRQSHSVRAEGLSSDDGAHLPRPCASTAGEVTRPSTADCQTLVCDHLLLATGGCRAVAAGQLAVSLGHTLQSPVPSLFTFRIETPWLRQLAGVSVQNAEVSVPGTKLRERGAVLLTHWGLSGPAILRLSAWGARALHGLNYHFPLHVNWLPELNAESLALKLQALRNSQPAKLIANTPLAPLSSRLWEQLVLASGIARETRWSVLSRAAQHALIQQLLRTELQVTGKSLNKDEFVTCGGVPLAEVNFKTMESKLCPGLHFAGELLDIDGVTGGFNFQAAWTTGWIAGRAMAELE